MRQIKDWGWVATKAATALFFLSLALSTAWAAGCFGGNQ